MFTEKNSNYFINLCRQYSDATLIPTTLRDNSVVLFSYQGEQMGLPHSQEPDAYIYNPYPNGPEFCGENPDILYAQIPIEGTTFKIYLGPVFPLGVTEEMLRNLMREQIVPLRTSGIYYAYSYYYQSAACKAYDSHERFC